MCSAIIWNILYFFMYLVLKHSIHVFVLKNYYLYNIYPREGLTADIK